MYSLGYVNLLTHMNIYIYIYIYIHPDEESSPVYQQTKWISAFYGMTYLLILRLRLIKLPNYGYELFTDCKLIYFIWTENDIWELFMLAHVHARARTCVRADVRTVCTHEWKWVTEAVCGLRNHSVDFNGVRDWRSIPAFAECISLWFVLIHIALNLHGAQI